MKWLQRVIQASQKARDLPYLGRSSFAAAIVLLVLAISLGWHNLHPDKSAGEVIQQAHQSEIAVPASIQTLAKVLPYLNLWVSLGVPLLLFVIWRRWGDLRRLMLPVLIASVSVAAWAIANELVEYIAQAQMTEMGESPTPVAFALKLVLLALVLISIPFALRYYRKIGLMERYTLRTFLHPLVFCFVSFFSLWIIMDLLDNLKDFQDAKSSLTDVIGFYLALLPHVYTQILPVALLLSTLYALTRMSRANELISMLGSGRSLLQVLKPIFVCTAYACCLFLAANYYWAPRAEGNREAIFRAMSQHAADSIRASSIMFHDEQTHRTWFVGTFPFSLRGGRERMHGLQIREENPDGTPSRTILAPSASWTSRDGWRFFDGTQLLYEGGQVTSILPFPARKDGQRMLQVPEIEETPWSIVSYALHADYMSVPELISYLSAHPKGADEKLAPFRTHLWHRFALPWQSLALLLVAAPLGVAYSRRGSVGGIAASVFIFFIFMFVNNFFLNLGKGDHLPPWLSVWMPHLLFGALGLILFHYRSQNRDLPRLKFSFSKLKPQIARPRNRSAPMSGASAT